MQKVSGAWFKFIIGLISCLLIRLIPFRPPNVEPILATQMPFAKAYGSTVGFSFAFLSIIIFDITTGTLGYWSLLTAGTYGILGIWASFYFKNRKSNSLNYAKFAILGTFFFDAVTGLSIGPIFFAQPFLEALMGQIPFTLWHLLGNTSFALILSPALHRWIIENKKFETRNIINVFNHQSTL